MEVTNIKKVLISIEDLKRAFPTTFKYCFSLTSGLLIDNSTIEVEFVELLPKDKVVP